MGAEAPKQNEKDPAVERAEVQMRAIEGDARDDVIVLSAKKEQAEKLLEETTAERDKALASGDAKALKKVDDLNREIGEIKAQIEKLGGQITQRTEKLANEREEVAKGLDTTSGRLQGRSDRLELRDDTLDTQQAELPKLKEDVARLRGECQALTAKPERTAEEQATLDSKLKELQDKQERIERIEAKGDRAKKTADRATVLRAEAAQIRADSEAAERLLADFAAGKEVDPNSIEAEADKDAQEELKQSSPSESKEGTENLMDSMTALSQSMALSIADNPPTEGDVAGGISSDFKQVLLAVTMAMSPKPLAWDAKQFDAGRREILEKVAGLKITDGEGGGVKVESVDPDPNYQAPAAPVQKVFREYFGDKWWESLKGVKAPVEDTPGTTLQEFEASIPNPPQSDADKDKLSFVTALKEAGMSDPKTQLLPWIEENGTKIGQGKYEVPASSEMSAETASALFEKQLLTDLETIVTKDSTLNSKSTVLDVIGKLPNLPEFQPLNDLPASLETYLTPVEGTNSIDARAGSKMIAMARVATVLVGGEFSVPPDVEPLLKQTTWSSADREKIKPVLESAFTQVKTLQNTPFISILEKQLASPKSSAEVKAQTQKIIDLLKAHDPKTETKESAQ